MKIFCLLIVTIGLSSAAPARSLEDDIKELINTLPLDKIREIVSDHLANDPDYKDAIDYFTSPDWIELISDLKAQKVAQDTYKYFLNEVGIDVKIFFEKVYKFLSQRQDEVSQTHKQTRDFSDFEEEISDYVDAAELLEKIGELTEKSSDFKRFYMKLSSETTHKKVSKLRDLPQFQMVLDGLDSVGIEGRKYFTYIYYFFGWYEF